MLLFAYGGELRIEMIKWGSFQGRALYTANTLANTVEFIDSSSLHWKASNQE
jgi:hypothetical protein